MKKNIMALIDVNNFYVSCEKAFSGALQTKPTIVLSHNDGCVVARSNDVKQWIKMGQHVFEVEDIIKDHDIRVFSSNYMLYATMSDRTMRILSQFSPALEVYSIDEAFADLSTLAIDDLTNYGKTMKARVLQFTGLPVSVGIASTKCLCKIAARSLMKASWISLHCQKMKWIHCSLRLLLKMSGVLAENTPPFCKTTGS